MPIDYSKFNAVVDSDDEVNTEYPLPESASASSGQGSPDVEGILNAETSSVDAPYMEGFMSTNALVDLLQNVFLERPELASAGPKAIYSVLQKRNRHIASMSLFGFKRALKTLAAAPQEGMRNEKPNFSKHGS